MESGPGEGGVALAIPPLRPSEKFHLFVSYSSVDATWTHGLISRLEADLAGLKVCLHERDFTPGRNVLENMAECIQQSQKVLLVLSQDFVQSRWCLLEADLSLFGSCLERKPVIPVLLRPCQVPLHLSHLTYLEAADSHFYRKVVQLLLMPNHCLARSLPAWRPAASLYSGKSLLTLNCVNRDSLPSWKELTPCAGSGGSPRR
uniref:TIR domain-containing protein n=1 Tax=Felis catus TaxID=9685 RepID=A0ABI7X9H3_FELCA